ncbi:uncharacterized protein KD926_005686 [Aspergillus affinis]|uniref:uncharacterized protein n=1 Tax=Aspergillus affinis TaxID=1070780 RepID=UPI0022FDECBE|nr:uncharacterized protein KD926_005686 [Aspergillus affinis]KAI9042390.1 hypothetical protein KD926_005686 [Aspergillus affinis]
MHIRTIDLVYPRRVMELHRRRFPYHPPRIFAKVQALCDQRGRRQAKGMNLPEAAARSDIGLGMFRRRNKGVFDCLSSGQTALRFLIFCEHSLILGFLEMLMDSWSVSILTIKSTANDTQREAAARAFVVEDSGVVVMLTKFQVCVYRLNLDYQCSRVIIAKIPRNLSTFF